jgi:oligopeptidase B
MDEHEVATPPIALREPRAATVHGHERIDDYFWLRNRDDPRVLDYLKAENAYTEAVMEHTRGLQEALYSELLSRIQETDTSAAVPKDQFRYYSRTEEGKQYRIYCRHLVPEGPEEILLDENDLAEGHDYFQLGVFDVSEDHTLLAYSEDTTGGESYVLHVKDLRTGELLPDQLDGTYYSLAWCNDGRSFYYTVHDEAMRPHRLYLHRLGEDQDRDTLVCEEADERFYLSVGKTRSKEYVLVTLESMTTSEVHFARAATGTSDFRLVATRRQDLEYYLEHQGDCFLIWTNDKGRNFRLVEAPVDDPPPERWKEVVPHRTDVKLDGVLAFANHVVRYERETGLPRLVVSALPTGAEHVIEMPEPVYGLWPGPNASYESSLLRFIYTSLTTPTSHFDYDMQTRERTLVKEDPILGDFDSSNYVTQRVFAEAPDGARIPISIVHRKGVSPDQPKPCLLDAYGSYGASSDPYFRSTRLTLLDRGFVFAIAHVRGGGELGKPWHDDGRMLRKRNTFTDFIACAEHLIAEGYTSSDRLVIEGGSAGGLLMGAVTNLRPDLFFAVVAHVPFVDALNTILDPTLPLTILEHEEWGNPTESREVYEYMLSYSPYDNVEPQSYPHLLVIGGLNDPRVHYWEPAKWVAKLRALKTDDRRLLLKTHLDTGHGGPSGRYDALREDAFVYAFVLDLLGITGQL